LKLIKTIINCDDIIDLEEMDDSVTKNLIFHKSKHNDFSYSVEPDYKNNKLIIKTFYLDEQTN